MTYRVEFSPQGRKQFRALPVQIQSRILPRLESLADKPRPSGIVALAGRKNLYRLRIGDYRAIYTIEDDVLLVLVVAVGHRCEVYR